MQTPPPLPHAWSGEAPPAHDAAMAVDFVGRRGALFLLAFKTGFFTILTLGVYRFWMKTRLRRWYWSAIRPGGHPMEYTGDPWEKLLGFFIAVVILTFYIGIVNLLLMFISFSLFNVSWAGYLSSVIGVIPIWFYARYRARRYVLGRTRWRGVRFGLEPGAWGFAWRALVHWLVTICTLGVLWPRMTFWLEKYQTDRTFFGSAKLVQGGRWPMLYRPAIPVIAALLMVALAGLWVFWLDPVVPFGADGWRAMFDNLSGVLDGTAQVLTPKNPWRLVILPIGLAGVLYGALHYRFASRRILANHKIAKGLRLASELRVPRVAGIYIFGTVLAYLVLVIGLMAVLFAGMALLGVPTILGSLEGPVSGWFADYPMGRWVSLALVAVMYLGVFLLWGVLHNTFVTFPLMRHMAETLCLVEHHGLGRISQRERDEFAEAEGFAEALDLGAAI